MSKCFDSQVYIQVQYLPYLSTQVMEYLNPSMLVSRQKR